MSSQALTLDLGRYHSPFEALVAEEADFQKGEGFTKQSYIGSLDDVLDRIERLARFGANSLYDTIDLVHNPPRVIRAVLDYKVDHPNAEKVEELLRDATTLALNAYSNSINIEEIERLRRKIEETGNIELLLRELKQPLDSVTWSASNPERSRKTAQSLAQNKEDLLFIALGHGGIAAGMDVYLRFLEISESYNSEFYGVRFSTQKLKDKTPQLSPTEIAYLRSIAIGRKVIIFDEDSCTGRTLTEAEKYFSGVVFPGQSVIAIANLYPRKELISAGFRNQLNEVYNSSSKINGLHTNIVNLYNESLLQNNKPLDPIFFGKDKEKINNINLADTYFKKLSNFLVEQREISEKIHNIGYDARIKD